MDKDDITEASQKKKVKASLADLNKQLLKQAEESEEASEEAEEDEEGEEVSSGNRGPAGLGQRPSPTVALVVVRSLSGSSGSWRHLRTGTA